MIAKFSPSEEFDSHYPGKKLSHVHCPIRTLQNNNFRMHRQRWPKLCARNVYSKLNYVLSMIAKFGRREEFDSCYPGKK